MTFGEDWGWGAPTGDAGASSSASRRPAATSSTPPTTTPAASRADPGRADRRRPRALGRGDEVHDARPSRRPERERQPAQEPGPDARCEPPAAGDRLHRPTRVHAWDAVTPVEEMMRALDDLVRAGQGALRRDLELAGLEVSRATTIAELRGWTPFVGIQVQYNLVERTAERELLPMAQGSTCRRRVLAAQRAADRQVPPGRRGRRRHVRAGSRRAPGSGWTRARGDRPRGRRRRARARRDAVPGRARLDPEPARRRDPDRRRDERGAVPRQPRLPRRRALGGAACASSTR